MTAGLLVSAPRSGSGKTVLTLGLMRAFARRGLRVAGAKNGPDYIDPAFHAAATGRASRNLDSWAMSRPLLLTLAHQSTQEADLLVCEGSMGLFDGVAGSAHRTGASADLAATLGLPVLLVLDVSGQAQTAAALAKGCAMFDPEVAIGGIILNRVASERHRVLITDALTANGFCVSGSLPRSPSLALPERHLGLVQAGELPKLDAILEGIADFVIAHVDLDAILAMARPVVTSGATATSVPVPPPGQRIAVARDAAFSFLYPHVIDGWREAGSEILFFSPLADEPPDPSCDACWLSGGYPELHAATLANARIFLDGLRTFAARKPVHGECGGYMVLGQTLTDKDGVTHEMAGLLGASTSFASRKLNLGYREATLVDGGPFGPAGTVLRGHEFHYATLMDPNAEEIPFAMARDAQGSTPKAVGGRRNSVTGSFFHVIAVEA